MHLLRAEQYVDLIPYRDSFIEYFPIIASVISQAQNGHIFRKKESFAILSKFGFAYLLGAENTNGNFLQNLLKTTAELFPVIRLYDPQMNIKNIESYDIFKTTRIKYVLPIYFCEDTSFPLFNVESEDLDYENLFSLNLCSRFWNNCLDFRNESLGVISKDFSGICYAAARTQKYLEVDVFVDENKRQCGYGKLLVKAFCKKAANIQLQPLWDCYANNFGSINLAKSIGFKELFRYDFYTIKNKL